MAKTGGCIYFANSDTSTSFYIIMHLSGVAIEQNTACEGTVVHGNNLTISFHTSHFASGAGVFMGYSSVLHLHHSTLNHNSALYGGVLYTNGGHVELEGCAGIMNNAASSGGFAVVERGEFVATDSSFANNSAFLGGQGMISDGSKITLLRCSLSSNRAQSGGSIYLKGMVTMAVNDSTFEYNDGVDRGGGIYCYRSDVSMNRVSIAHNSALSGGGSYWNMCLVNCMSVLFAENHAVESGGAVHTVSATMVFTFCAINHNMGSIGGAFYFSEASSELYVNSSTFLTNRAGTSGNLATEAAAVLLWDAMSLGYTVFPPICSECVYDGNQAAYSTSTQGWASYSEVLEGDCHDCKVTGGSHLGKVLVRILDIFDQVVSVDASSVVDMEVLEGACILEGQTRTTVEGGVASFQTANLYGPPGTICTMHLSSTTLVKHSASETLAPVNMSLRMRECVVGEILTSALVCAKCPEGTLTFSNSSSQCTSCTEEFELHGQPLEGLVCHGGAEYEIEQGTTAVSAFYLYDGGKVAIHDSRLEQTAGGMKQAVDTLEMGSMLIAVNSVVHLERVQVTTQLTRDEVHSKYSESLAVLQIETSRLTVADSVFTGIPITVISLKAFSILKLSSTVISDIFATSGPAVVSDVSSTMCMAACDIVNNEAMRDGGAMRLEGEFQIVDSRFIGNKAVSGGALYLSLDVGANLTNTSVGIGQQSRRRITGTELANNSAVDGAAMYINVMDRNGNVDISTRESQKSIGFWLAPVARDCPDERCFLNRIYKCETPGACTFGDAADRRGRGAEDAAELMLCDTLKFRNAVLCGGSQPPLCSYNYTLSFGNDDCTEAISTGFGLLFALGVILTLHLPSEQANQEEEDEVNDSDAVILTDYGGCAVSIMVGYYQLLGQMPMLYPTSLLPSIMTEFLSSCSVFNFDVTFLSNEHCMLSYIYSETKAKKQKDFWLTFYFYMAYPMLIISILVLAAALYCNHARTTRKHDAKSAVHHIEYEMMVLSGFGGAALFTLMLIHPQTAMVAFQLYRCREFYYEDREQQRWVAQDLSVECYDKEWSGASGLSFFIIITFVFGFPVTVLCLMNYFRSFRLLRVRRADFVELLPDLPGSMFALHDIEDDFVYKQGKLWRLLGWSRKMAAYLIMSESKKGLDQQKQQALSDISEEPEKPKALKKKARGSGMALHSPFRPGVKLPREMGTHLDVFIRKSFYLEKGEPGFESCDQAQKSPRAHSSGDTKRASIMQYISVWADKQPELLPSKSHAAGSSFKASEDAMLLRPSVIGLKHGKAAGRRVEVQVAEMMEAVKGTESSVRVPVTLLQTPIWAKVLGQFWEPYEHRRFYWHCYEIF
eukprot:gene11931-14091_t